MAFTRKHYKAVAEIVRDRMGDNPYLSDLENAHIKLTIASMGDDLVRFFASGNPGFDREKFLNACGIT